jgi:hypothetical protein
MTNKASAATIKRTTDLRGTGKDIKNIFRKTILYPARVRPYNSPYDALELNGGCPGDPPLGPGLAKKQGNKHGIVKS